MPSDDYIIALYFIFKLKYKSTCMSGYVPPNIMIKVLEEVCKTPNLYINANVSIRRIGIWVRTRYNKPMCLLHAIGTMVLF